MSVTVIVPVYNVEKYISKCLDSIRKQTYEPFLCYVINDGTKDNSMDVAKEIVKDDGRFVLFDKENGGYGSVLEYAIDKLETEYCLICDSDDYLAPNALESLMKVATTSNADIVAAGRTLIYENSDKQTYDNMNSGRDNILEKTICFKGSLEYNNFYHLCPSPHAKLFKSKILKGMKFPHHTSYTDNALYLLALEKANSAVYLKESLAFYLINRENNTMGSLSKKYFSDNIKVYHFILDEVEASKEYNDFILFRIFDAIKVLMYELKEIQNKEDFMIECTDIKTFMERLLPYKKTILKYQKVMKTEGNIAQLKNYFLLNKTLFSKYYDHWMRKLRNYES